MKDGLLTCLIPVGTIYGPVELTRVILNWEGFSGKFMVEIGFMWLFYGLALLSLILILQRVRRMRRNE